MEELLLAELLLVAAMEELPLPELPLAVAMEELPPAELLRVAAGAPRALPISVTAMSSTSAAALLVPAVPSRLKSA
jgi:hypothetical protein